MGFGSGLSGGQSIIFSVPAWLVPPVVRRIYLNDQFNNKNNNWNPTRILNLQNLLLFNTVYVIYTMNVL